MGLTGRHTYCRAVEQGFQAEEQGFLADRPLGQVNRVIRPKFLVQQSRDIRQTGR